MSYKTEFPDYDGRLFIPEGFHDYSYHNDTCPCAAKEIGMVLIRIWQDYIEPNKREREGTKRYALQVEYNGDVVFDYATDELERIKELIECLEVDRVFGNERR